MNSYYTVRIELNGLDPVNTKMEYRDLYRELKKRGFTDSFFDNDDNELKLPDGMYAIMKFDFSQSQVCIQTEAALEAALRPYYESGYNDKYTIVVSGASYIISRNLDPVK